MDYLDHLEQQETAAYTDRIGSLLEDGYDEETARQEAYAQEVANEDGFEDNYEETETTTLLGGRDRSVDDDFTDAVNGIIEEKSFEEQLGYEPGSYGAYMSLQ